MKACLIFALFTLLSAVHLHAETYTDSSITFSYPAQWKLTDKNDSLVRFNAGKNFTFSIRHIYTYNGDGVKYASDRKKAGDTTGIQIKIENADVGKVFAVKITELS